MNDLIFLAAYLHYVSFFQTKKKEKKPQFSKYNMQRHVLQRQHKKKSVNDYLAYLQVILVKYSYMY